MYPEPVSIGARLQNEITEGSTLWVFQYFSAKRYGSVPGLDPGGGSSTLPAVTKFRFGSAKNQNAGIPVPCEFRFLTQIKK